MSGARPERGARFSVERVEVRSERIVYRGFVHLPDADLPLEVTVDLPSGAAKAHLEAGDAKLEATAAALVRAATKQDVAAGTPTPRKIVRWRG